MSTSYRRYEILLPRRFNDGRRTPNRFVTDALIELREQFGAASCETQTIRGQWQHQGEIYHDELVRVFVDETRLRIGSSSRNSRSISRLAFSRLISG